MKKFIWALAILSIIGSAIGGYILYSKSNKELNRRDKRIETIELDRQNLFVQLRSIELEKDSIKAKLVVTLDSIEKLTAHQAKTFIVRRYKPQTKIVSEIEAVTGKIVKRPTIVLDSVVAIEVVKDLVGYDATLELLENCQEANKNLSEQLKLVLEQNNLVSSQANKYRKQRNLYSVPFVGNVLALPNFIKMVVN